MKTTRCEKYGKQIREDIEKFKDKYGKDLKCHKWATLPVHGIQSLKKLRKNGLPDHYFTVDHPMVWKDGNKIKAFTISLYDTSLDDEIVLRYLNETSFYTNGRYKAEAFTADKLNVYFDKDKWARVYVKSPDDWFRSRLKQHVTIVLTPIKEA